MLRGFLRQFTCTGALAWHLGVLLALGTGACKGDDGPSTKDGGGDAAPGKDANPACPPQPIPVGDEVLKIDDFGPNAALTKTPSALSRMNVYEATSSRWLNNVEVYISPALPNTRITIAVGEAPSKMMPFKTLVNIQIDVPNCPGFVDSGPLDVLMKAGSFYAVGYDPNQVVNYASASEMGILPVDGAFGRLVGSRTDSSVSLPMIPWDKFTDKEYYRQRLTTEIPAGM